MKIAPFLIMLVSCSIIFKGNDEPKSAKNALYSIHFNKSGWVQIKDKRSDYVFENSSDKSILLSNSFCDEFQDQTLEILAARTFKGISQFITSKGAYGTFNGRESYHIEGSGLVDGVKVNLSLTNTRRDHCYFDFLSIIPDGSGGDREALDHFLKTVDFR